MNFFVHVFIATGIFASFATLAQHLPVNKDIATPAGGYKSMDEALKASGLDRYVSAQNERAMEDAAKNLEKVKKSVGVKYGGSWIEYDAQNNVRLIIGVKGAVDAPQKIAMSLKGDSPSFVQVNYSYDELEQLQQKILAGFQTLVQDVEPLVFGVAIFDPDNKVVVRGRKENLNAIRDQLVKWGVDMGAVVVETQEGPATLW